jgi:thiol:disulfide interchange protein DsbC
MKLVTLALATTLMFAATAQANESVIRKALTEQFPSANIASVKKTPYSGLFEVYLDGQLIYVDAKAQYVFAGDVIDHSPQDCIIWLNPSCPQTHFSQYAVVG